MSKKCKRCEQYKPLIGEYCADCHSLNAYDSYCATEEIMSDVDDSEINSNSFKKFYDGYCSCMINEYNKKKLAVSEAPTLSEAYEAVFVQIMQENGISQSDIELFKPQLYSIVKQYVYQLKSGFYRITTKNIFEDTHPGIVKEVKGRWVVYCEENPQSRIGVTVNLAKEQQEFISAATSLIQKYLKE